MKQISKKEQFYRNLGESMSMNSMRCFINLETLEVDIFAGEDYMDYSDDEEEDPVQEALNNPDKFLPVNPLETHESFKIMEAFTETVKNKSLQLRLINALERKKPFSNFKNIIDNSTVRQDWFDFRDKAHIEIAKEWIEKNAGDKLKEKIKSLPSVFITE